MCGRYQRRGDKQKIAKAFRVVAHLESTDFAETDDAAPGSVQPVVLLNKDGERDLTNMRWGFKMPARLLFNTRSESVATSKFWKDKFADKRCIIPASAFFEWQGGKGHKTKYEVTIPHHTYFGMAAVWAPWKNAKTNKWEDTFSIITSDPNKAMVEIHDRQPVILEARDFDEWLSETERPPVHLLRVYPDDAMRMKPVEGEKKPAIKGLFG